jgi:fermentation-respiration switch protein FrsA (DUF1100 family)
VALLSLVYVTWIGVLYFKQREMLFPGAQREAPDQYPMPARGERVWLDVFGAEVEAWFLPRDGDRSPELAPTVLFMHGNAELIDDFGDKFWVFRQAGANVMLVEYPGYGRSGGEPGQDSLSEAVRQAYDYLLTRDDVDANDIVAMGRAMGAGPLCVVSRERDFSALILQSTFTSITDVAARYLAPSFIVRDPFDNLSAVRDFRGPILIAHGRQDGVVGYSHGVQLSRAGRAHMMTWNCHHADCPPDWPEFLESVLDFLRYFGLMKTGA